jgi:hypothetical protein
MPPARGQEGRAVFSAFAGTTVPLATALTPPTL